MIEASVGCKSTLSFSAGQTLSVRDGIGLDPNAGTWSVFMVHRVKPPTGSLYFFPISKGSLSNGWSLLHGIGGSISAWLMSDPNFSSAPTQSTVTSGFQGSDRFQTWGVVVDDSAPAGWKQMIGYTNGNQTGWSNGGLGGFRGDGRYAGSLDTPSSIVVGSPASDDPDMQVLELAIFNRALSPAEVNSLQQYYDEEYHLTCPTLSSANARSGADVSDVCVGAREGDRCRQQCSAGNQRVAGTEAHRCTNGAWTGHPIVCQPLCPALASPANAGSCSKITMLDFFEMTDVSQVASSQFSIVPLVPATEASSYWEVDRT